MYPSMTPSGNASRWSKKKSQQKIIEELNYKEELLKSKKEAILQVEIPVIFRGEIVPFKRIDPKVRLDEDDTMDEEFMLQQQHLQQQEEDEDSDNIFPASFYRDDNSQLSSPLADPSFEP